MPDGGGMWGGCGLQGAGLRSWLRLCPQDGWLRLCPQDGWLRLCPQDRWQHTLPPFPFRERAWTPSLTAGRVLVPTCLQGTGGDFRAPGLPFLSVKWAF